MSTTRQPKKRLSAARVRLFFAVLMRNETVFRSFRGQLKVEHFAEEHYQLVYRLLLDGWEESEELLTEAELRTELEAVFEVDPDLISEEAQDDLESLLDYAYSEKTFGDISPTHEKMERYGFRAGKRFLQERLASEIASNVSAIPDLDNLTEFFRTAASQAQLLELQSQSDKPKLSFSDGFDKAAPLVISSSGLDFLDRLMGGGTAANEVYGLMAPYGTCKTTLAVMLWCLAAKQACAETVQPDWDGRKGLSFLVTYEASLCPEIQHRALMYAASIHRDSLSAMGHDGLDALGNDPNSPLPYEQERFANEIADGAFIPERQRIEQVLPYLNEHTVSLDFTGADKDFPAAGHGGVDEIVSRIRLELRNRGEDTHYVKNVIIDYLGLMVDRDCTLNGPRRPDNHLLYQQAVSRLQREVSVPFHTHTWVMHQLSGAANAMLSPTKRLHHTDAKGSKSVAENMDFAFVVGNLNLDQLGQIVCTKHRRAKAMPPIIIKVDGEFNLVYSPANYHVDSSGQIVDQSIAATAGIPLPEIESEEGEMVEDVFAG